MEGLQPLKGIEQKSLSLWLLTQTEDIMAGLDVEEEERRLLADVMSEAPKSLTSRQFQCLWLQLLGFNQEEIADLFAIKQQAVSRLIERALESIRRVSDQIRAERL